MPEQPATGLDALLRALAHPARRRALALAAAGPVTSSGLARALGLSQSTAWRHLRQLELLGLLRRHSVAEETGDPSRLAWLLRLDPVRLDEGLRDVLAELARVREACG